jgi:hypothetical protein
MAHNSDFEEMMAALAEEMEQATPEAQMNSLFILGYIDWIRGTGAPVDNPAALLAASGIRDSRFGFSPAVYALREAFIARIGYAVPTSVFCDVMRPLGPVVEIAAGRGYLSAILRHAGIDSIATDRDPSAMLNIPDYAHFKLPNAPNDPTPPVEALDAEAAVAAYPDRTILCSWPGYQEDWLTKLAQSLEPGRKLVVIGEGPGGCTADDSFFDLIRDGVLKHKQIRGDGEAIWSFPAIHDRLDMFERS